MLLTAFVLSLVCVVLVGVAIGAGTGIAAVVVIAGLVFGIPMFASDRIASVDAPTVNAFALDRSQKTATVCATIRLEGRIAALSRFEV